MAGAIQHGTIQCGQFSTGKICAGTFHLRKMVQDNSVMNGRKSWRNFLRSVISSGLRSQDFVHQLVNMFGTLERRQKSVADIPDVVHLLLMS